VLERSKARNSFQTERKQKEGLKCFDPKRKDMKRFEKSVNIFLKREDFENMIINVRRIKGKKFT